ncbi:hypothetical protein [Brevibacillus choshinensis]|uniref:JAB domain-containing protein n=1 Tax=Brevibacillus choshinensis TaxID=54911 RepID=A0ABX7FIB9_BRECH|nr:hypothetical protein [Brevibacillus choshinensis]QRG65973.1 hypothetical protein JNE38_20665 [Brevibacillus choshinensis]
MGNRSNIHADVILDSFNLSQNAFSTILLDAIQFFPQEIKKMQAESHGLLFGIKSNEILECDYVFPVGNVTKRAEDEVEPNSKIDNAINNARQILSTSRLIGTYHSHPYDKYFEHWADPSNMDVACAKYDDLPFMLIVAITRDGKKDKPLSLGYQLGNAYEFYHNQKADGHDLPITKPLTTDVQYIMGEFKKYRFEIRAYQYINDCLRDVNLYSSEAEMLMELLDQNIDIASLSPDQAFRLRKIEYNRRRLIGQKDGTVERERQNTEYHLQRLKGER